MLVVTEALIKKAARRRGIRGAMIVRYKADLENTKVPLREGDVAMVFGSNNQFNITMQDLLDDAAASKQSK